ncbi:unnamed protein product [Anisakis simplex]|uniref:ABC transporter ATP-binding protein n=1 Tax=Anisakis simplex TaxID=6269 RepID=A0A0M3JLG3_ANISI|nr:unnamed protein product [Anisakis simplex]VDK31713.1 unnamed protein product [Anisakis simplex]
MKVIDLIETGNVLKQLSAFVNRKRAIESDKRLSADIKRKRIENLTLTLNGTECRISDLSLTFS